MFLLGSSVAPHQTLPEGCALSFSSAFTFKAPTGATSGKRLYLFHGLNSSASYWESEPYLSMINAFRSAGCEVIAFNLPTAQTCFYSTGGWQYREDFNAMINTVINTVEASHGAALKSIIGGVSYGGLHAMMGTAINGRFCAWWAHLPVVRVDALTELTGVGNAQGFNPQFEVEALGGKPGMIGWGTADTRVNWALAKDLADKLPNTVTKHEYPGLDHTTNSQGVADIVAWVSSV